MIDSLLNIVPGTGDNAKNFYFDNMGEPFIYALIGFAIVFAGIVIIITVIWLLGLLMRKTNNFAFLGKVKEKNKKPEKPSEADGAACADDVPDDVKAAIVAAIMAYYETSEPKCEFTVKRIKRL